MPLGEEEGSTPAASTRGRAAHCFLTLCGLRPGCIIWKAKRKGNQAAAAPGPTTGGELLPLDFIVLFVIGPEAKQQINF